MNIRVVSYNVHRCIGRDGRQDVERIFRLVNSLDADIIGLQEVDHITGGAHTAETLRHMAEDAGYLFFEQVNFFRPVEGIELGYGNALLFKGEVSQVRYHNLSVEGFEPRGILELDGILAGTGVRILNTHLGLNKQERLWQLQELMRTADIAVKPRCVLVLGDFNEWLPASFRLWKMHKLFGHQRALPTWPSFCPLLALDRIWAWPASCIRDMYVYKGSPAKVASDHLPLVAELDLSKCHEDF